MVTHARKPKPITPEISVPHDCGKPTKSGAPCRRRLREGQLACLQHGGQSPRARRAALDRLNQIRVAKRTRDRLGKMGGHNRVEDVYQELEDLIGEVAIFRQICWERLEAIGDTWRYDSKVGEQLRAEVALYERAMDRSNKVLTDYAKLGIAEKRVKIAEAQAMILVGVIQNILGRLDLSRDQKRLAASVVPEELRAIEAPRPES